MVYWKATVGYKQLLSFLINPKTIIMEQWRSSLKERFSALSCMMIWLIMIGMYVVTGILSFEIINPIGFWQVILWLIAWHIVTMIIEVLFAVAIMWISSIDI